MDNQENKQQSGQNISQSDQSQTKNSLYQQQENNSGSNNDPKNNESLASGQSEKNNNSDETNNNGVNSSVVEPKIADVVDNNLAKTFPEKEKVDFSNYTPEINSSNGGSKNGDNRIDKNDSQEGDSKTGTIITAILIIIITFGIWQVNKGDNVAEISENNNESENSVVVDDTMEEGNVTIIDNTDEVNNIEKVKITAYYSKNVGNDCSNVTPLEREIKKKYDSLVVNTVRGLLTPLSSDELAQGWSSSIPLGTYLRNVVIKDGVAKITLSANLNKVAGSCAVTAARAQIEKTLLQFSYINSVEICVDDNCNQDEILQP